MGYKVIKVKQDNYDFLVREAAAIQYETGKKASFDDALTKLRQNKNKELLKFAGAWTSMSDTETKDLKKELRKGWNSWKA